MCDSSGGRREEYWEPGHQGSTSVLSPGNGTSLIRPQERWGNWGGGSNNSRRWPLPVETLKTYHPPWCLSKHKQIARDFPVYWPWNIEATMRRERTVWLGRWLDYSNVVVKWLISNYHRTEYWALRISSWVVRRAPLLSDIPPLPFPPGAGGQDSRVWKCNSYNYCYGKIWWWFWRSLPPSHVGWKLIFHPIIYRNILVILKLEIIYDISHLSHLLHSTSFLPLVKPVMISITEKLVI